MNAGRNIRPDGNGRRCRLKEIKACQRRGDGMIAILVEPKDGLAGLQCGLGEIVGLAFGRGRASWMIN